MSTSNAAASNVVPLLARLVLAAAFIPAGWNKFMGETTFDGEDAAILRSLGVGGGVDGAAPRNDLAPVPTDVVDPEATPREPAGATTGLFPQDTGGGWSLLAVAPPAALPATPPATPPPPPATPPADAPSARPAAPAAPSAPVAPPPSDPAATPPTSEATASTPPVVAPPSPLKAGNFHHVTLMAHRHGLAYPVYHAWAAVVAELVGGALILVGLFSRIWGLALASVMVVAFWFTSWPLFAGGSFPAVLFQLPIPDFNRVFCQAGLFVLAFGVFLTGPGAVSIDRALFGRAAAEK